MIAELRESANDALGQTDDDADMDRTNNGIVVNEKPHFETWDDVVEWARAKIVESAAHDGDGEAGRAFWYEKQPPEWRPDLTNVPIAPIEKGGPEYRYPGRSGLEEPTGMAEGSDPLDRAVASWTEEDVRTILSSPAYLQSHHPGRCSAMSGGGSSAVSAPGRSRSMPPGARCGARRPAGVPCPCARTIARAARSRWTPTAGQRRLAEAPADDGPTRRAWSRTRKNTGTLSSGSAPGPCATSRSRVL
jgi:hypothetical protein